MSVVSPQNERASRYACHSAAFLLCACSLQFFNACVIVFSYTLYLTSSPIYFIRGKCMSYEGVSLGHYQLLKLIGSGGMSDVYLANDPLLHRQVAIKLIHAGPDCHPNTLTTQKPTRL